MPTLRQTQLRVAFYIRVSTDEQVEKFGIDLQLAAIKALVASKGKLEDGSDAMVLAGDSYIYVDEGISGSDEPRERPAFARMLEDIETATEGHLPFDAVVVYKIDRFARRLKILLEIVDFLELYNIQFISANESIDTSSPFGKAILGILGVIAELEIETTKMRTLAGKQQAIDKGLFMGKVPPYGFNKDIEGKLIPIKDEVKTINEMFAWCLYERLSPQQIADRLGDLNVPSPGVSAVQRKKRKGSPEKKNPANFWRATQVRKLLMDEIYIGNYFYGKTQRNKNTGKLQVLPKSEWKLSEYRYKPIVEPQLFYQVQKLLLVNSHRNTKYIAKEDKRFYPLSGLLRCQNCAEDGYLYPWHGLRKLISKEPKKYSYYYVCSRKNTKKSSKECYTLPIPAEPLEDYVRDFVLTLLDNPEMVFKYQQNLKSSKLEQDRLYALRNRLLDDINGCPRRIENLRSQHTLGIIDTKKLTQEVEKQEQLRKTHEKELEELNKKIGDQELSKGYLNSLSAFSKRYKESLSKLRKDPVELRSIFETLIDHIVVISRPVVAIDSIAGRKKEGQMMPYAVEIHLRLPEEILTMLAEFQFSVKPTNW